MTAALLIITGQSSFMNNVNNKRLTDELELMQDIKHDVKTMNIYPLHILTSQNQI